jgi:hypothetical protein
MEWFAAFLYWSGIASIGWVVGWALKTWWFNPYGKEEEENGEAEDD